MEDEMDFLLSNSELKDILIETRKETGMNRKEFADYFRIPYRTVQDWELGKRQMPEYLLRLIKFRVDAENEKKNK
jgi:DNA-binding transcriptional regulator YiaG